MDWFPLRAILRSLGRIEAKVNTIDPEALKRIELKVDALDRFIRQQFEPSMADVSGSATLTGHVSPESADHGATPMKQFALNDKDTLTLDPIDLSACTKDQDNRQLLKADGSPVTVDDLTVSAAVSSTTPLDASNTTEPVIDASAYTDPKAGGVIGSGQPGSAVVDFTIGFPDGSAKVTQVGFTVGFSAPGEAVITGTVTPEA